jgi:hypothetical protein
MPEFFQNKLMFFKTKKIQDEVKDIVPKLQPLNLDEFIEVQELYGFHIAPHKLLYSNGGVVHTDFVKAQLLTRELSKDYGIKLRLPTLKEDYIAFKNCRNKIKNSSTFEWKAQLLDGSFMMRDPDVRSVNLSRKYDFNGTLTIIEPSRHPGKFNDFSGLPTIKNIGDNGNGYWLGVSEDKYGRAAVISNSCNGYCAGAIPPLSDCLGIRLLIDENVKEI